MILFQLALREGRKLVVCLAKMGVHWSNFSREKKRFAEDCGDE